MQSEIIVYNNISAQEKAQISQFIAQENWRSISELEIYSEKSIPTEILNFATLAGDWVASYVGIENVLLPKILFAKVPFENNDPNTTKLAVNAFGVPIVDVHGILSRFDKNPEVAAFIVAEVIIEELYHASSPDFYCARNGSSVTITKERSGMGYSKAINNIRSNWLEEGLAARCVLEARNGLIRDLFPEGYKYYQSVRPMNDINRYLTFSRYTEELLLLTPSPYEEAFRLVDTLSRVIPGFMSKIERSRRSLDTLGIYREMYKVSTSLLERIDAEDNKRLSTIIKLCKPTE